MCRPDKLSVLVTGMTGSLGSSLSKYYLSNPPERLVCFSRDWWKQRRLRDELGDPPFMRWMIGDVRDKERLQRALENIDIVIHAAAIKDIVSCEYDSFEAVKTNVIGTQNVIEAAIDNDVRKVLVISSDKSADALNCYGRTKALAESLAVAGNVYARHSRTRIAVCRYGNVVGSNGSVVPIFQEQAKTGTLMVTDRRMSRFFIPMSDAVEFVIDCLDRMSGGEIFVPKMPSVRIVDVAEAIAPGCEMKETGIRPGEKLHETMIVCGESRRTYDNGAYYTIVPELEFWDMNVAGEKVSDGFTYTSDTNTEWFSVEEIRELIN